MTASERIRFSLNGREVAALPGEPILEVARREGIEIPHLCFQPGLAAVGQGRAELGGGGAGGGHAGDDLAGDPMAGEERPLLPDPAEDGRIAAFQAHHA